MVLRKLLSSVFDGTDLPALSEKAMRDGSSQGENRIEKAEIEALFQRDLLTTPIVLKARQRQDTEARK